MTMGLRARRFRIGLWPARGFSLGVKTGFAVQAQKQANLTEISPQTY
jgi:hypothetical protein